MLCRFPKTRLKKMAGLYIWNASPMGAAHPYFFLFFAANTLKINDLYCFTLYKSETNGFNHVYSFRYCNMFIIVFVTILLSLCVFVPVSQTPTRACVCVCVRAYVCACVCLQIFCPIKNHAHTRTHRCCNYLKINHLYLHKKYCLITI